MKFFRPEWRQLKGGVSGYKIFNVSDGTVFESGNCYMGGEFSDLRGQSDVDQGGFDQVSEFSQAVVWVQGHPENPRRAAGWEMAKPGNFQGWRAAFYCSEGGADQAIEVVVHLANEAQGQVDLLGRYPAGAGQICTDGLNPGALGCRQVDGDEESRHGKSIGGFSKRLAGRGNFCRQYGENFPSLRQFLAGKYWPAISRWRR